MRVNIFYAKILCCFILGCSHFLLNAQSDITINGVKINKLDKKKRKQGDWVFFDENGFVKMSCVFDNAECVGTQIFYENTDTSFVRIKTNDTTEVFALYKNKKKYYGSFIYTSDTTSVIEVDPEIQYEEEIIQEIRKYKDMYIFPIYFFGQKKMRDYLSASFASSNYIFNKPIHVIMTISASGIITNVELPKDKNNLNGEEEKEIKWIYSTMPRWQPFFFKNKTKEIKIRLSNNATVSYF